MNERRRSKASATTPPPSTHEARYGIAMLKIAMELKKSPGVAVDQVVSKVASQMGLKESELRAHLTGQGRLLLEALGKQDG